MTTKSFSLGTVLTVTTGRLLTTPKGERDNGIGDLYELLEWMSGKELVDGDLRKVGDECKPWLMKWFPELSKADCELDALDDMIRVYEEQHTTDYRSRTHFYWSVTDAWLSLVRPKHGLPESLDIPKIPKETGGA